MPANDPPKTIRTQPVVLQAVIDHGTMTRGEVMDAVGLTRSQVDCALASLVAAGRLVRAGERYSAPASPLYAALRQAASVWHYAARLGEQA